MTDAAPPMTSKTTSGGMYRTQVATRTSGVFVWIALIALVVLAFAPSFASRPIIQDLITIFCLASLALCWNLLAGYAGLISVGQQAFVGLGGYALFALIIVAGFDPLASVPLAALIVALISIPVGFVVFRLQGAYFAVVTWVVAEVFRLLLAQWQTLGGGTGISLPRAATSNMIGLTFVQELFDVRSAVARDYIIYWAALITAVIVLIGCYYLLRSRVGLGLRAIKDSEIAAQSVGVSTTRIKFTVHVFAAFGAGLAGAVLFLKSANITPDAAFSLLDWTAYVIFIVVIGGLGTIEGPVIGAILFVLLRNWLSDYGPWYLIILGVLGIAIMLLAPKGIWGNFSQWTGVHLFPTRRRLVAPTQTDKPRSDA